MYIPEKVKFIIDRFKNNNYEAFIVGGSVRDSLLNRKVNDYDITTNALPSITESLFDKTIPTGIKHGTITILIDKESFEVTTYRIDGEYIDNRKPKEVIFVSDIEKDLSRRDFTINALAYNPDFGIKDYFNGIDDLNNKIIRAVGEPNLRFQEDALRILRAIRFAAQLNFKIEENTLSAIKTNNKLIKNISKERIRDELLKMLTSNNPQKAILELYHSSLIDYIFNLDNSSYNNIEYLIKSINTIDNDLDTRLTHFFFYLFNGDLQAIELALKNFRFDNARIKNIVTISQFKNYFKEITSKRDLKKMINLTGFDLSFKILNYNLMENPQDSNVLNELKIQLNNIIANSEPIFLKDLNITGKCLIAELNLKGKSISNMLNLLLEEVLLDSTLNNYSDLLKLAKKNVYLIK